MLIADLWYIIVYQPAVAIVYFSEQKEKENRSGYNSNQ